MRVALINSRLSYYGGLETRLLNYINYFAQRGDDVYVIVYRIDKSIVLPKGVNLVKINIRWTPKSLRSIVFDKKVEAHMKNNHYDFSLSLGRTSSQDAVLAPSSHLGYVKAMNISLLKKKDKDQIKLDQKAYDNSKIVFACSQYLKNEIINEYHVPPEKVSVLRPPLNVGKYNRQYEKERDILRDMYGMKKNEKVFVFVSIGHKHKGLDLLLKIFKSLEGTNNILYVAGSPRVDTTCRNIRYIGFDKETNKLFTAADFTIHPAKYEAFGQIISESMACGTPVIISSNVGAKEIVTSKTGIVVNSLNSQEWVDVVKNVDPADFEVPIDHIEKNGLSTRKHIETMLTIWKEMKVSV